MSCFLIITLKRWMEADSYGYHYILLQYLFSVIISSLVNYFLYEVFYNKKNLSESE